MPGARGRTPRQKVEAEVARRGPEPVVAGCIAILDGTDIDDGLVGALGGEGAAHVLGGHEGGRAGYWPRVWAARALFYCWDSRATDAIVRATGDDSWRVREMSTRVIARHGVDAALPAVLDLRGDPVARVRAGAERAVAALTVAGA